MFRRIQAINPKTQVSLDLGVIINENPSNNRSYYILDMDIDDGRVASTVTENNTTDAAETESNNYHSANNCCKMVAGRNRSWSCNKDWDNVDDNDDDNHRFSQTSF